MREEEFIEGEKLSSKGPLTKILRIEARVPTSRYRSWSGSSVTYEQQFDARGELLGIIHRVDGVGIARCIRTEPDDQGHYRRSYWAYWSKDGDLLGTGVFREGKPWEGICFSRHQDGSLARTEFGRYQEGNLLEKVQPPVSIPLGETPIPQSERK